MESFDNSMKELYYKNIEIAGKEELQREIEQYRESNNADELESLAEILRACKKNEDRLSSIDLILPKEQIAVTSEKTACMRTGPRLQRFSQSTMKNKIFLRIYY